MLLNFSDPNTLAIDYYSQVVTLIIDPVLFIFELFVILISIFGRKLEELKWFVGHTALFNLLAATFRIYDGYFAIAGNDSNSQFRNMIYSISVTVSLNSMFPLALSRVAYFYFRKAYSKTMHKRWPLFLFLLGLDSLFAIFYVFHLGTNYLFVLQILILTSTLLCSSFVLFRLKDLLSISQLSENSIEYSSILKIMLLCIFQSISSLLLLLNISFLRIYMNYFIEDQNYFLYIIYILSNNLHPIYFTVFAILESIFVIIVIRIYRDNVTLAFAWLKCICRVNGVYDSSIVLYS